MPPFHLDRTFFTSSGAARVEGGRLIGERHRFGTKRGWYHFEVFSGLTFHVSYILSDTALNRLWYYGGPFLEGDIL